MEYHTLKQISNFVLDPSNRYSQRRNPRHIRQRSNYLKHQCLRSCCWCCQDNTW